MNLHAAPGDTTVNLTVKVANEDARLEIQEQ